MLENIKRHLTGIGRRFAERMVRGAAWVKDALNSREARLRIGYYAGLALLLMLLGMGSHAWRMRGKARTEAPVEPPRAAAAVYAATLEPTPAATPEPVRWVRPLEGDIIAPYSPEAPVWSETLGQWQTHPALDIAGSPGEAVYACRDGVVSEAWSDRLWGNVVAIDHDEGYRSTYAGLNTLEMVREGDRVEAGQVIGSVGQSAACEAERGWHLHFELTRDGQSVDFDRLISAEDTE